MRVLFCAIIIALLTGAEGWFFWPSREDDAASSTADAAAAAAKEEREEGRAKSEKFRQVGFEMLTQDERMQKELAAVKEMSQMGACYYRVLDELKLSCGSMSEEEIGKLSVQLLNCQSEVENRRTYRCDNYMTIGECTRDMDATVWNTYQIVSNRARAICYQVRQQQFKIKTELTVDKLVQSSESQLLNLKEMHDRQAALKSLTEEAVSSLSEGHERLRSKQENIEKIQTSLERHMEQSLEQLERQKKLTEEGTERLGSMTELVQNKLDIVAERIEMKDAELASTQTQLLQDLSNLRSTAESVGEMLTETQALAMKERTASRDQHRDVILNLERINETAVYVAEVLLEVKASLESQLDWIYRALNETGAELNDLKLIGLHLMHVLLTMLLLSFVGVEAATRWASILAIVANCFCLIRLRVGLQLHQLALSILVICLGRFMLLLVWRVRKRRSNAPALSASDSTFPNQSQFLHSALSTPDIRKVIQVLEKYKSERKDSNNMQEIIEESSPIYPPRTPPPPSPSTHYNEFVVKQGEFSAKRSLLRNFEEGQLRERYHKSLSPSRIRAAPPSTFETDSLRGASSSSARKDIAKRRLRGTSPSRYSRSRSPSRLNSRLNTKIVQKEDGNEEQA